MSSEEFLAAGDFNPAQKKTITAHLRYHTHPLIIADTQKSPYLDPQIALHYPSKSLLALPLTDNHRFLGAALIGFNQPHRFNSEDIYIGEQAAQQIALAIIKNRSLAESRQSAKEAETLRQAGAAVVSSLQQDEVIERILQELNRVIPYDSASVLLPVGDEYEIVGARGFPKREQILRLRFRLSENTPNAVIYRTEQAYILEDAPAEYEVFLKEPHRGIRGWMGIPLLIHDQMIGMLTLDSHKPGTFNQHHARLASAFADQVTIALENMRLFAEVQSLATIDPLTELYNRRQFMEIAECDFQHAKRYQEPLSMIMIDIDHFKMINDTCGHRAGDIVLKQIARICRGELRKTDTIARYGGEEFIVILPQTTASGDDEPYSSNPPPADVVAQRLGKTVCEAVIQVDDLDISVTISIGIAALSEDCGDIHQLIDRADQALYRAKQNGRNRSAVWEDIR